MEVVLKLYAYLLIIFASTSCASGDLLSDIDNLKNIGDMPYICREDLNHLKKWPTGCGSPLFWRIVKQRTSAVQPLIDKLGDSTSTNITVPTLGYTYTVADIAYAALKEIIHDIPTFDLLKVRYDEGGCGYCSYWHHLNSNYQHRVDFKKAVQKWYDTNRQNLIWIGESEYTSCDCIGKHPSGGYYGLRP